MPKSILELQKFYADQLQKVVLPEQPQRLYEPVSYLLSLGGKRIRPTLALAGCNIFCEEVNSALPMAHAVEYFHNFSLMHDDIMDAAELRRGKLTVHKKYDTNTAILSGDVMLIYAYKFIEQCDEVHQPTLLRLFNNVSQEICEGQQMDMDFETRDDVRIDEYIQMITLKTAVLLGASLQYGAILGGAEMEDAKHLYEFGKNIGIAFQVQDDILDVFASSEASGKLEGGDIIQKKKTYLYLKSLELLSEDQAKELRWLYSDECTLSDDELVSKGRGLLNAAHVKVYAQELKENYQQLAFSHLDALKVDSSKTQAIRDFADNLLNRTS